jgi:Spy/CpxP family protein refolding chaperone
MRMRMWAAAGALVVAGTVLAVAQERGTGRAAGRPDRARIEAELGLSPEQSAQLQKMKVEGRKQAIRQRADLAVARIELEELMDAPVVDQKAIDAKVKAISDLQAAALKARTDERLALRKILTPEQQAKMKQLRHERRAERGARPARAWRGRGPAGPAPQGMAPVPPGPGGPWADEDEDPPSPEPER